MFPFSLAMTLLPERVMVTVRGEDAVPSRGVLFCESTYAPCRRKLIVDTLPVVISTRIVEKSSFGP